MKEKQPICGWSGVAFLGTSREPEGTSQPVFGWSAASSFKDGGSPCPGAHLGEKRPGGPLSIIPCLHKSWPPHRRNPRLEYFHSDSTFSSIMAATFGGLQITNTGPALHNLADRRITSPDSLMHSRTVDRSIARIAPHLRSEAQLRSRIRERWTHH